MVLEKGSSWAEHLPSIGLVLQAVDHRATGLSLHELMTDETSRTSSGPDEHPYATGVDMTTMAPQPAEITAGNVPVCCSICWQAPAVQQGLLRPACSTRMLGSGRSGDGEGSKGTGGGTTDSKLVRAIPHH